MEQKTIGRFEMTVTEADTAAHMGSGSLPVLATPALVAMMEHAACNALSNTLEPGLTTVGTRMDVSHDAASPLGMRCWAEATLTETNGRMYTFSIQAFDEAGPIGKATHQRASVKSERFMEKTNAKMQK